MNPIATAIIAGIAKLADPMIRDGYNGLKSLLKRTLGPQSPSVKAIEELEAQPSSKGKAMVVHEELDAVGGEMDAAVLQAAQQLTEMVKALPEGQQIVSQIVSGEGHTVVGIGDVHVQRSA
jgi:hypothetical protein